MVEKAPDIDEPHSDAWIAEQKRQKAFDANDQPTVQKENMRAALLRERAGYEAKARAADVRKDEGDKAKWDDRVAQVNASLEALDKDPEDDEDSKSRRTPPKTSQDSGGKTTRA